MNHIYAVSDLHGQYTLWTQIKEYIDGSDTLYILGDCADRGPDGWKIITEALDMPNVKYLKGNHEDMLVNAMRSYKDCPQEELDWYYNWDHDYKLVKYNGGAKTFQDWLTEGHASLYWATKLNGLAEYASIKNKNNQIILMTHAGFTPGSYAEHDFLWSRDHFLDDWWLKETDNVIVVHGHTPIPYLMDDLGEKDCEIPDGYYRYCNGHKIDIDCGAHFTGHTTLLDLDTLDQHIFYC